MNDDALLPSTAMASLQLTHTAQGGLHLFMTVLLTTQLSRPPKPNLT